jgi:hypothetical protein
MRIEQTHGPLQVFSEVLFSFIERLSGERPQRLSSADWYQAKGGGVAFVYLRLIGERARTFPPNSVHLATKWDDRLAIRRVVPGNNWYGDRSADLTVEAVKHEDIILAEEFIRIAFQLYGGQQKEGE